MGDLKFQVSAYSSFARTVGLGYEQQHKRRLDNTTNEPLFTNVTRDFIGSLDYIFYTGELFCTIISFDKFNFLLAYLCSDFVCGFSGFISCRVIIRAIG